MSGDPSTKCTPQARSAYLSRCDNCGGLHLTLEVNDRLEVAAVLGAEEWATLFMQDDAFAKAVASRLGRN